MGQITYIDQVETTHKRVLLRVDMDVPVESGKVINTLRLERSLPTIKKLLEGNNKIICVGHLGRPEGRDMSFSLQPVVEKLQEFFPDKKLRLISDFLTEPHTTFNTQTSDDIFVLENIRFYPEEKSPTLEFTQKLASLGDIFVQDAFGTCHREETSVTELPKVLPSYGGLSLKEELTALETILDKPQHPYIVIIGGIKTETKLPAMRQFLNIADTILLAGAVGNTFLAAQNRQVGKSVYDAELIPQAKELQKIAAQKHVRLLFPTDAVVLEDKQTSVRDIDEINNGAIMDIGLHTQATFDQEISEAKTIVWNGPVGDTDDARFTVGSLSIYKSIIQNRNAYSLIGGGDTTTIVEEQPDHKKISYISTGGGALLEYIEKGTLPGIEVLKK